MKKTREELNSSCLSGDQPSDPFAFMGVTEKPETQILTPGLLTIIFPAQPCKMIDHVPARSSIKLFLTQAGHLQRS